jgi:hypothetical protein
VKPEIEVDLENSTVRVTVTIAAAEDVPAALNVVVGAARMVFPDGLKRAEGPGTGKLNWPPAKGSLAERVLNAVHELKTTNSAEIADELDIDTRLAGMMLAKIRTAGHLKGLE